MGWSLQPGFRSRLPPYERRGLQQLTEAPLPVSSPRSGDRSSTSDCCECRREDRVAWGGESLEVLLTFLGTGELGSSRGAPLTSSAQQMVAAGHCQPGSDVCEAGAGEPGSGQMSLPQRAGRWAFCLTCFGAACPSLLCPKKLPPPPTLLFFLEHIGPGSCLGKDMHTSGAQRSLLCRLTFQPRD